MLILAELALAWAMYSGTVLAHAAAARDPLPKRVLHRSRIQKSSVFASGIGYSRKCKNFS